VTTKAKNRAEFPATAAILDKFRKEFGDGVKLIYAAEGGREIGKKQVAPKRFMTVEQWLRCSLLISAAEQRLELSVAKQTARRGVQ
jgi:hypothetical protein